MAWAIVDGTLQGRCQRVESDSSVPAEEPAADDDPRGGA